MRKQSPIVIDDLISFKQDGFSTVTSQLFGKTVFYKSAQQDLSPSIETFISLALVPAMRSRQDILINSKVSAKFLSNLDQIQEILQCWDSRLTKINIHAKEGTKIDKHTPEKVGVFFSGGLDSLYTFLKNKLEITDLIFIYGFDLGLDKTAYKEDYIETVKSFAHSHGVNLVEVHTNFNQVVLPLAPEDWIYGAMLSSVGHTLQSEFKRIYVAADFDYARLRPAGTHPLLDPLWGNETLEIVHDGCELSRLEKIPKIAMFNQALKVLRVCFNKDNTSIPNGYFNCGRCEKCLRTMTALRIHGHLNDASTFFHSFDPDRIAGLRVIDQDHCGDWEDCLDQMQKSNLDPSTQTAIREGLRGPDYFDLEIGNFVKLNTVIDSTGVIECLSLSLVSLMPEGSIEGKLDEVNVVDNTFTVNGRSFVADDFEVRAMACDQTLKVSSVDFTFESTTTEKQLKSLESTPPWTVLNGKIENLDAQHQTIEVLGFKVKIVSSTQFDRDSIAKILSRKKHKRNWIKNAQKKLSDQLRETNQ